MGIKKDPNNPKCYQVTYSKRHRNLKCPISSTRKGFKTLAAAKRGYNQLVLDIEDKIRRLTKPIWGELLEEWIKAVKQENIFAAILSEGALDDYSTLLRNYASEWEDMFVEDIAQADAWQLLRDVENNISKSRAKKLRSAIDNVFKFGILSGRLKDVKTIPTQGYVSNRKTEKKIPKILTLEEIKIFLNYARKVRYPWYPIWATALFTGMRSGELYALNWRNVDLEAGSLYVQENWTNKSGIGPTKARNWRTIPISSELRSVFHELKLQSKGGFSEQVWKWKDRVKGEKEYYLEKEFVLPRFQAWKDGRAAEILRKFLIGTGITEIPFHALRACFATQLMRANVAPAIVQKIGGWEDLKTMQRYVRLAGIEVKGATEGLRFLDDEETMAQVVNLFKKDESSDL